jgi:uncharacterized protein (TIGR02145 family)
MKKLFSFLIFTFLLLAFELSTAQNVGIGTNNPRATLDVTSTTNGFLPPRMTRAQRNAIVNPAAGLIIYCTDCASEEMQYYNGRNWLNMAIGKANGLLVKDADGNIYPAVTIGTQVWMAENLRTTKYRDGSNIPLVENNAQWANNWNNGNPFQLPMMCWFNNDKTTYINNKMGALYNWYAINPATNGNKNVCPTGWHVPSDDELTTLTNFLDGESFAGGNMKTTGTQYWASPNQGATNSSGFSGLPGGRRSNDGAFNLIGTNAYWWSTTEAGANDAWFRALGNNVGIVDRIANNKTFGFSVRCLRD